MSAELPTPPRPVRADARSGDSAPRGRRVSGRPLPAVPPQHRPPEGRPLDAEHPLLPELEHRLAVALGGDDRFGPLATCWPSPAAAHAAVTKSFYTNNVGGLGPLRPAPGPDIACITGRFARIVPAMRVSELRDSRLMPCADEHGQQLLTGPIPLDRWIVFETEVDGRAYRLHQGQWYEVERCRRAAGAVRYAQPGIG
ncbi:hypothetical protein JOF41_003733 [Saccharothrix coeruleofusca]|uniref:TIGR04141 family sporadically distributed protein n=1 Tax=Saccharothrix coeruleofusca TaxID=33919 RepID=UPI001AE9051C|nr:TIGR04141 family sporadically distributed protein [Saccharothrix coeruleofusca]MBP2337555.1 hypothetical protein [Saccharothrix coeruleofusca]